MRIPTRDFWRRAALVTLLTLFFGAGAHDCLAQTDEWGAWKNGIAEPWWLSSKTFTNQEAETAMARWKVIVPTDSQEVSQSWAGDYYSGGETHGTFVRWSPAGFVIADVDRCQALVMGLTYGRVKTTGPLIQFTPEFSKSSKLHAHVSSVTREPSVLSFILVRWRDRLFLIPQNRIQDFADYVAGLGDFNGLHGFNLEDSFFYSRYAGKDAVANTPVLPQEYQRFLKKPITAKVTAIEGKKLQRNYSDEFTSKTLSFAAQYELASLTFVRVNVGSTRGAKKGMFFRLSEPDLGEIVRLIDVGQTSSRGVLVRSVENGKETYYDNDRQRELSYPRVVPGWKLTTALR